VTRDYQKMGVLGRRGIIRHTILGRVGGIIGTL